MLKLCNTKMPKNCSECNEIKFVKAGFARTKGKKIQKFQCMNCGKVVYGLNLEEVEE